MTGRHLLSHVDLRVRDRARAKAFYDVILGALGATGEAGKSWTEYAAEPFAPEGPPPDWLAFTEEPSHVPDETRIAFGAESKGQVDRIATLARELNCANLEGPLYEYGPGFYAVFFDDPDGNRLEVCWYDAEEASRASASSNGDAVDS
jgi:catechol 2,3-dioxygenase-like lactoylglutathione lyase family enzyme